MDFLIQLLGPLHPPLVHFAVASPILAFFALLAQRIWKAPWLSYCAAALWVFTFLSALAALVSGHLFSLHLGMVSQWSFLPPESAEKGHLRDHALAGTLATLFCFVTLWAALRTFRGRPLSPAFQLALGLSAAGLFGLAGHEGGEMVWEKEAAATPSQVDLLKAVGNYREDLVKMNSKPWNSRTHGHRWVNTYVSREAVSAYKNDAPLPEGSLVVKESFQDEGGKPSGTPGPLYVMHKGKEADSPDTHGWQYSLSWDQPVPGNPEGIQMPVKWLPGDPHLASCARCHNHFKGTDFLGGVPDGFENP